MLLRSCEMPTSMGFFCSCVRVDSGEAAEPKLLPVSLCPPSCKLAYVMFETKEGCKRAAQDSGALQRKCGDWFPDTLPKARAMLGGQEVIRTRAQLSHRPSNVCSTRKLAGRLPALERSTTCHCAGAGSGAKSTVLVVWTPEPLRFSALEAGWRFFCVCALPRVSVSSTHSRCQARICAVVLETSHQTVVTTCCSGRGEGRSKMGPCGS